MSVVDLPWTSTMVRKREGGKKRVHLSKPVRTHHHLTAVTLCFSCIIYRLAFSHHRGEISNFRFYMSQSKKNRQKKNQFLFYLPATTAPECWMCKQWPELFSLPRSLSRQHVYYFLPWRERERDRDRQRAREKKKFGPNEQMLPPPSSVV